MIFGKDLTIEPWPYVESFGVGERGQLDEIAIADRVTRQDHQVVVGLGAHARPRALPAVSGGDVGFHAYDRLEPRLCSLFLELPGPVQVTVISDGERGLLQFLRSPDQIIDPVGSIEERVFGVAVEVDE